MPNWVTNKISTSEAVIRALLNTEGSIDFSMILPFPGPNDWDFICCAAEEAAEIICAVPVHDHQLIGAMQRSRRATFDIRKMNEDSFRQFVGMVENFRAGGYLHSMQFAREVWGTKWNACEPKAEPEAGTASFDTAWSCPQPLLIALSSKFPEDEIRVSYADEDIGSNCGTFTLKGGAVIAAKLAPSFNNQTAEQRAYWRAFAYDVKGWEPDPEDEEDGSDGDAA